MIKQIPQAFRFASVNKTTKEVLFKSADFIICVQEMSDFTKFTGGGVAFQGKLILYDAKMNELCEKYVYMSMDKNIFL